MSLIEMGTRKLTKREKQQWTKVPILNDEYLVIVVFGNAKVVRLCLEAWHYGHISGVKSTLEPKRGVCFRKDGCHPVVAMPRRPQTEEEWGTLAHEACHAVEKVFQSINQPTADEVFAHAVGAVVRIAGRWCPRKKKKR